MTGTGGTMLHVVLLIAVGALASWGAAGELRVGAAAVKITPPVGVPMAGYYHARLADGVHDELYAKAIVFDADGEKAALVGLDIITTTRGLVVETRRAIEETTGLRGDRVMISATHAHTGPVISDTVSERIEVMGGDVPVAVAYRARLPALIAEAVRQAEAALAPANVAAAIGCEESIAFNRRFHMKDGSVGWNPGKLNPNILKPAGPIDPAVSVIYCEGADKKPIATYVNYTVHLDNVGGLELSADMPATLSTCIAAARGPAMVTLYTTGACGDVNHIDVAWGERQHGHENAARMGVILAGEVLRSFPRLKNAAPGPLRVRSALVKLPLAPVTAEEAAQARAALDAAKGSADKPLSFMEQVHAYKALDVAARRGEPLEAEVQVVTLGTDIAWVSLPGEVFVELGLAVKGDSPFPCTIVAELANGSIGYIPSRRAYPQGNYEVVSARCAEGSGELLVAAAVGMLKEIHRGLVKK